MSTCIALLRGINVGRAKRIAMADLRRLVESLGHTNVRTLLNSGNVVFEARQRDVERLAAGIESAIVAKFGFDVAVVVLEAGTLAEIIRDNPFRVDAAAHSKFLVAFAARVATLAKAQPLLARDWAPDALAVGTRTAYLGCAEGILVSPLSAAFERATQGGATSRNWATVLKLAAVAGLEVGSGTSLADPAGQ
jgi:uncharacterized protein (DUF1697 family)